MTPASQSYPDLRGKDHFSSLERSGDDDYVPLGVFSGFWAVLPQGDRAALDARLVACPPCLDFVHSYRETPRIPRDATTVEMPPEVARRLEQFLSERRRSK